MDYTITFATYNCLDYTRQCLDSLLKSGTRPEQIIAVDNGSTDGTREYLQSAPLGQAILNRDNLSCGAAWDQGILARQSEWTIVMNNDIVVTDGFAERLINYARTHNLRVLSPARVDGQLDYDFDAFAQEAQQSMSEVVRQPSANLICLLVHWSVFMEIGFFRVTPKLLGFEDGIFFHDLRKAGVAHATTGHVWIHHFGSVTQEYMKMALGIPSRDVLVKVKDRQLLNQSWIERKLYRHRLKQSLRQWRQSELAAHGKTLHGVRQDQAFVWL